MPAFDIDAALRWARLDPGKTLARRTDEQLPFLSDIAEAGRELLLDTCVYIDGMQGRSPDIVADLLDVRQVNHSTIAIQELMHTVGVLDPRHSGTKVAVGKTKETIAAMPGHRIFTPDTDVLGRGAMLSGILCRIQGYRQDARLRALHDCVLFLQAQKLGLTVLTANSNDFDYLLQLMPSSRVLLYRVNA